LASICCTLASIRRSRSVVGVPLSPGGLAPTRHTCERSTTDTSGMHQSRSLSQPRRKREDGNDLARTALQMCLGQGRESAPGWELLWRLWNRNWQPLAVVLLLFWIVLDCSAATGNHAACLPLTRLLCTRLLYTPTSGSNGSVETSLTGTLATLQMPSTAEPCQGRLAPSVCILDTGLLQLRT
jgi:hypothetical protein